MACSLKREQAGKPLDSRKRAEILETFTVQQDFLQR